MHEPWGFLEQSVASYQKNITFFEPPCKEKLPAKNSRSTREISLCHVRGLSEPSKQQNEGVREQS